MSVSTDDAAGSGNDASHLVSYFWQTAKEEEDFSSSKQQLASVMIPELEVLGLSSYP